MAHGSQMKNKENNTDDMATVWDDCSVHNNIMVMDDGKNGDTEN